MEPPDPLDQLAADWISLWESEVTALAQDTELAEAWAAGIALMAAFWRAQAATAAAWPPRERPAQPEAPRPAPPATAPAAEPGPGAERADDATALRARLDELERRLASIEGGKGGGGADRPRARRAAPRRKPSRG